MRVNTVCNSCISENGMIVQEILHGFKEGKLKKGMMGIKIDMQNSYDKFELIEFSLQS